MDFFKAQEQARRRTKLLVAYFAAAVLGIAIIINLVLYGVLEAGAEYDPSGVELWDPLRWVVVTGLVLLVILGASGARMLQFRQGGGAVARALGGRKVDVSTRDALERRLVNVVEEMAVASGVPMPEVYILEEEQGINAFASGLNSRDAAVAVTRGALEGLSRDELQGVMAHEFAHILNGDMRLNVRIAGIIFGIVVLALIGRVLMRSIWFSGGRSRGNSKGNGGVIVLLVLGITLMLCGLIGEIFGRLIQAAVSRQREYLADAAAVQFTRNPTGIAGALKRIGGATGRIENGSASGMAHFFFASAMKSSLGGAFATHPPLPRRIKAVDPGWDGQFLKPRQPDTARIRREEQERSKKDVAKPGAVFGGAGMVSAMAILASVGNVNQDSITCATRLLQGWPEALREAIHQRDGARAVWAALLLSSDEQTRRTQLEQLQSILGEETVDEVLSVWRMLRQLPPGNRLPLAELSLPALRGMKEAELLRFREPLEKMVAADGQVSLFEACLMQMLKSLVDDGEGTGAPDGKAQVLSVSRILSRLALLEADDEGVARRIFERHTADLRQRWKPDVAFCAAAQLSDGQWSDDFDVLARLPLVTRRFVLESAIQIVVHDQRISVDEAELLRVMALTMDCPMPLVTGGP